MGNGEDVSGLSMRAMGTDVEVLVVTGSGGAAPMGAVARVGELVASRLERLEESWSRFRPTSELSRLNAAAGRRVVVSETTFDLVRLAVESWRSTGGRYDPTILDALLAAGYDRDFDELKAAVASSARAVDAEEIREVHAAPGCAGIDLDPIVRAVRLPAEVRLDLGGIGKGYAADLVSGEVLRADIPGVRGVLVNMGGDLHARGEAPALEGWGTRGWVVEVDDPLETGATGVLLLAGGAIATSTRLRRTWQRDGMAAHHLIDPRTGVPGDSGVASVTVVAGEAWRAEVLAKAAFLAGADAGVALVTDAGATGLVVSDAGEVIEMPGLEAFRPRSA